MITTYSSNTEYVQRFLEGAVLAQGAERALLEYLSGRHREQVAVYELSQQTDLAQLASSISVFLEHDAAGREGQREQHYRLVAVADGSQAAGVLRLKIDPHHDPGRNLESPTLAGMVGQLMRHSENKEQSMLGMMRVTAGCFESVIKHLQGAHDRLATANESKDQLLAGQKVREFQLIERERQIAYDTRVMDAKVNALNAAGAELIKYAPLVVSKVADYLEGGPSSPPALPPPVEHTSSAEQSTEAGPGAATVDQPLAEGGAAPRSGADLGGAVELSTNKSRLVTQGVSAQLAEDSSGAGPAAAEIPLELKMFMGTFSREQLAKIAPLLDPLQRKVFFETWSDVTGNAV